MPWKVCGVDSSRHKLREVSSLRGIEFITYQNIQISRSKSPANTLQLDLKTNLLACYSNSSNQMGAKQSLIEIFKTNICYFYNII